MQPHAGVTLHGVYPRSPMNVGVVQPHVERNQVRRPRPASSVTTTNHPVSRPNPLFVRQPCCHLLPIAHLERYASIPEKLHLAPFQQTPHVGPNSQPVLCSWQQTNPFTTSHPVPSPSRPFNTPIPLSSPPLSSSYIHCAVVMHWTVYSTPLWPILSPPLDLSLSNSVYRF